MPPELYVTASKRRAGSTRYKELKFKIYACVSKFGCDCTLQQLFSRSPGRAASSTRALALWLVVRCFPICNSVSDHPPFSSSLGPPVVPRGGKSVLPPTPGTNPLYVSSLLRLVQHCLLCSALMQEAGDSA